MTRPRWCAQVLETLGALPPGLLLWDADFTLWADDVGIRAWGHSLQHEALRSEAAPPLAALLERYGSKPGRDAAASARRLVELYEAGGCDGEALIRGMVSCYAGYTPDELHDLGRLIARRDLAPSLTTGLSDLLDELGAAGHRNVVISASAELLVEGAISELGLRFERVSGVRASTHAGRLSGALEEPVCYRAGKLDRFAQLGLEGPIYAAFSDSDSDIPLLEQATLLRAGLRANRRLRAQILRRGDPWRLFEHVLPQRPARPLALLPQGFGRTP